MIGYLRSRRAAKRAYRVYELARLEGLMAENQRRLDELKQARVCKKCAVAP